MAKIIANIVNIDYPPPTAMLSFCGHDGAAARVKCYFSKRYKGGMV